MKFDIRNRWTGAVKITAEIDCAEDAPFSVKLGLAVRWAVGTGADLTRANLTGANLTGADLTDADLTDADLARADLTRANLTGANLTDADLTDANLADANLTGANLTGADLTRANLTGANLTGADLTDADLAGADLRSIRVDLFDVLLRAIPETPTLLATLRAGRINGSAYQGDCACLSGTIAKARGVHYETMDFVDAQRPAERFFLAIKVGDTPKNSSAAKIVEAWILEFLSLLGLDETGVPKAQADVELPAYAP